MMLITVIVTMALLVSSHHISHSKKTQPIFPLNKPDLTLVHELDSDDDFTPDAFIFDSSNVRSIGRWPFGTANAVTYANIAGTNYVILGSGGGVYILDITNPGSPVKVGQLITPGRISGLFVQNNYLYVLDGTGLRIFDISNPQLPIETGVLPTGARCIFVLGNYAYLGDFDILVIADISNPHQPSFIGEFYTGDLINDLFVRDSFVYITNSDSGFRVINVAEPSSPQLVGSLVIEGNYFEKLDVSFPNAYVTGEDEANELRFLRIVDVSNPGQPTEIGRLDFSSEYYDYLSDILVNANLAFVTLGGDYYIGLNIIDVLEPSLPRIIGDWEGPTGNLALANSYLFIAAGTQGLRVVDVADPTSPILTGFIELHGSPKGLAIGGSSNEFAYIASASAGLRIVSVFDPYHPQEVGALPTPNQANDVSIRDTIAFVANGSDGIMAIGVQDPASPYLLWQKLTPGYANAIFTHSDKIYVASDSGLVIMQDSAILALFNTEEPAVDVFVVDQYAYVAAGDYGLRIIDVNDPYAPFEVGYCDTIGYVYALFVHGNYTYLATDGYGVVIVDVSQPSTPFMVSSFTTPDNPMKVYAVGQYVFVTDESGNISVVDVSNPTLPVLVGSFNTFSGFAYDIVVLGQLAYVTDGSERFFMFNNVLDFKLPTEVGTFPVPDWMMQVSVLNPYAYLANYHDGMRIFDVAYPQNPIEVSQFDTPALVLSLAVRDNLVYLGERLGLRIVNVTNPSAPFEVGYCWLPDDANSVYLSGNFAYIACDNAGLQIVDISAPSSPVLVGFYDTNDATDVFVVDTLAFIADRSPGLRILSVANPDSIYQIGLFDPGNAYAVEVVGNYAYVIDYAGDRLVIIDVSNPRIPFLVGSWRVQNLPVDLSISGNYAYVANRRYGMRVIDIANPYEPIEVGYYDTPGRALGIKAIENLVYVADYSCGFIILEFFGLAVTENEKVKIKPVLQLSSNPVRPFSAISYSLFQEAEVHLSLYDITGRQVRVIENTIDKKPGRYDFNLGNLANGIYFLKLETENYKVVKKIVLLN